MPNARVGLVLMLPKLMVILVFRPTAELRAALSCLTASGVVQAVGAEDGEVDATDPPSAHS